MGVSGWEAVVKVRSVHAYDSRIEVKMSFGSENMV
jgi:hypothetical protein